VSSRPRRSAPRPNQPIRLGNRIVVSDGVDDDVHAPSPRRGKHVHLGLGVVGSAGVQPQLVGRVQCGSVQVEADDDGAGGPGHLRGVDPHAPSPTTATREPARTPPRVTTDR
jgi:hypothetical protein